MKKYFLLFVFLSTIVISQIPNARFKDGIKLYLSADSSSWLKATMALQTWVRYTDNNPGSTINKYPQHETFDIGIRRARLQLFGNVTKRVFFYSQFGINSFNSFSTRKTGAFFHDLTTEYTVLPKSLSVGAGLTGWSGLARFASPSIATTMMYDAPLFEQATNDVTDQFLRKLGVYAKGKISKLDYRVAISKPMNITTASTGFDTTLTKYATFSPETNDLQYQGYFMWQFLDQESNQIPYTQGTYLGKKRVFNIGAGFIHQASAMRYLDDSNLKKYAPMNLWALDVYFDYSINKEKETAISLYGGYFNYDFGPNYIRAFGVMNSATGSNNSSINKFSGFGNAYPMIGTGNVIYLQAGYLFKRDLFGKNGTIMPNADILIANYHALSRPLIVYDFGINYYIVGHNCKISINYQDRPVFSQDIINPTNIKAVEVGYARRGMAVIQYQVYF